MLVNIIAVLSSKIFNTKNGFPLGYQTVARK